MYKGGVRWERTPSGTKVGRGKRTRTKEDEWQVVMVVEDIGASLCLGEGLQSERSVRKQVCKGRCGKNHFDQIWNHTLLEKEKSILVSGRLTRQRDRHFVSETLLDATRLDAFKHPKLNQIRPDVHILGRKR